LEFHEKDPAIDGALIVPRFRFLEYPAATLLLPRQFDNFPEGEMP
jgi:hypothetical protein